MRRVNFKTDAIARFLALQPYVVLYRQPKESTPEEIERETERLNGLPKSEQLLIACQALGFDPLEYLMEKAKFNAEVEFDQEAFPGCVDWEGHDA